MPLHLGFWKWITNTVRYITWKIFPNKCTRSYKKYTRIRYNKQPKITLSGWKLRRIFKRGTWLFRQRKGKSKQYSQQGNERRLQVCREYFPGVKKKTFPAVLRRLFSLRAGSLLSGVSHYGTAAYDIIGSRLWKKWLKPLVLPYTLVHCIPSFHTSILPSLPQCRIVFIRHTMLSLSVMLSPWRWAGARLLSWPPGPG